MVTEEYVVAQFDLEVILFIGGRTIGPSVDGWAGHYDIKLTFYKECKKTLLPMPRVV